MENNGNVGTLKILENNIIHKLLLENRSPSSAGPTIYSWNMKPIDPVNPSHHFKDCHDADI